MDNICQDELGAFQRQGQGQRSDCELMHGPLCAKFKQLYRLTLFHGMLRHVPGNVLIPSPRCTNDSLVSSPQCREAFSSSFLSQVWKISKWQVKRQVVSIFPCRAAFVLASGGRGEKNDANCTWCDLRDLADGPILDTRLRWGLKPLYPARTQGPPVYSYSGTPVTPWQDCM